APSPCPGAPVLPACEPVPTPEPSFPDRLRARDELRLDRKLVRGQAQRLARLRLRHALHLVEDASRLDDGHPGVRRALALAHSGFLRLLRNGLVREEADPDAA